MNPSVVKQTGTQKLLEGNFAAAYGALLSKIEVAAAYPITPQTTVVEHLADFIDSGMLKAKLIKVESEHSALSALVGAASAGVRTFTATSRQGLLLMHEVIVWAARGRMPIVMAVPSAAVGAPYCIDLEQDDVLMQRDAGWLQFFCQDNQEILDTIILAYKVGEQMSLPAMVIYDGVLASHTAEPVLVPDTETVDRFLPRRETEFKLDVLRPMHLMEDAGKGGAEYLGAARRRHQEDLSLAQEAIILADEEFGLAFGRRYGLMECYKTEGADAILVATTSVASIAHEVVDQMRAEGKKVGLLRIRLFRPFPANYLRMALGGVPKVAVLDRDISYGQQGVLAIEIKAALYNEKNSPAVFGFVGGISGLEIRASHVRDILNHTLEHDESPNDIIWIGVPEPRGQ